MVHEHVKLVCYFSEVQVVQLIRHLKVFHAWKLGRSISRKTIPPASLWHFLMTIWIPDVVDFSLSFFWRSRNKRKHPQINSHSKTCKAVAGGEFFFLFWKCCLFELKGFVVCLSLWVRLDSPTHVLCLFAARCVCLLIHISAPTRCAYGEVISVLRGQLLCIFDDDKSLLPFEPRNLFMKISHMKPSDKSFGWMSLEAFSNHERNKSKRATRP